MPKVVRRQSPMPLDLTHCYVDESSRSFSAVPIMRIESLPTWGNVQSPARRSYPVVNSEVRLRTRGHVRMNPSRTTPNGRELNVKRLAGVESAVASAPAPTSGCAPRGSPAAAQPPRRLRSPNRQNCVDIYAAMRKSWNSISMFLSAFPGETVYTRRRSEEIGKRCRG
jgi:hypothetical protein